MSDLLLLFFPISLSEPYFVGPASIINHLTRQGFLAKARDIGLLHEEESIESLSDEDWSLKIETDFFWESVLQKISLEIEKEKPRLLALTAICGNQKYIKKIIEFLKLKYSDLPIVVGGPFVTVYLDQSCKEFQGADYLVSGLGEIPLVQLLIQQREKKSDAHSILGVLVKKNDIWGRENYKKNTIRPRYLVDMSFYANEKSYEKYFKEQIFILLNIGCPFRCSFCSGYKLFGGFEKIDYREAIAYFIEKKWFNRVIYFTDPTINADPIWLYLFAKELINSKLNIRWRGWFRLGRSLQDKHYIRTLYESGCRKMDFGLESASPRVLSHMKKFSDIKAIYEIFDHLRKISKEEKIFVGLNLIIGYPLESDKEFQKTLKFLSFNHDIISACTVSPFFLSKDDDVYKKMADEGFSIEIGDGINWRSPFSDFEIRKKRIEQFLILAQKLKIQINYSPIMSKFLSR